jgi:hypothetical protein
MAATTENIRLRFPEFSDETEYPDARIQLFIDDAVAQMGTNEKRWCGKYDIAQAYLVAHFLTLATNSEAGDTSAKTGPVQSKTAGGVSVTRAASDASKRSARDDYLLQTAYGQRYDDLRRQCFVGVRAAVWP